MDRILCDVPSQSVEKTMVLTSYGLSSLSRPQGIKED
jgi:hypothetical protein